MSFREFPVLRPADDQPGPEFGLGEQRFGCVPSLPAGVLADSPISWPADLAELSTEQRSVWVYRAAVFVRGCVLRADEARFDAALMDKADIVEQATLLDVARWLVEEYTPFDPRLLGPSPNGHGPMSLTGVGPSSPTGGAGATST